jgi:Lar family restriction alleviation protein
MDKLKSCPFCGKYPQAVVDDETEEKFGVKCFNCGGSIYPEKDTLRGAIEAWNRRVSDDESESD